MRKKGFSPYNGTSYHSRKDDIYNIQVSGGVQLVRWEREGCVVFKYHQRMLCSAEIARARYSLQQLENAKKFCEHSILHFNCLEMIAKTISSASLESTLYAQSSIGRGKVFRMCLQHEGAMDYKPAGLLYVSSYFVPAKVHYFFINLGVAYGTRSG